MEGGQIPQRGKGSLWTRERSCPHGVVSRPTGPTGKPEALLPALPGRKPTTLANCTYRRVPTCYWRGCLRGWCGCCPCLPRAWCGRRRISPQASLSGSAEWCPGGPGTLGRASCSDRPTASSSRGPGSPPGHLEGQRRARVSEAAERCSHLCQNSTRPSPGLEMSGLTQRV